MSLRMALYLFALDLTLIVWCITKWQALGPYTPDYQLDELNHGNQTYEQMVFRYIGSAEAEFADPSLAGDEGRFGE